MGNPAAHCRAGIRHWLIRRVHTFSRAHTVGRVVGDGIAGQYPDRGTFDTRLQSVDDGPDVLFSVPRRLLSSGIGATTLRVRIIDQVDNGELRRHLAATRFRLLAVGQHRRNAGLRCAQSVVARIDSRLRGKEKAKEA